MTIITVIIILIILSRCRFKVSFLKLFKDYWLTETKTEKVNSLKKTAKKLKLKKLELKIFTKIGEFLSVT